MQREKKNIAGELNHISKKHLQSIQSPLKSYFQPLPYMAPNDIFLTQNAQQYHFAIQISLIETAKFHRKLLNVLRHSSNPSLPASQLFLQCARYFESQHCLHFSLSLEYLFTSSEVSPTALLGLVKFHLLSLPLGVKIQSYHGTLFIL